MFRKLRIYLIRELIELNEKMIFNLRLIKFYKRQFDRKINLVIDVGANTGQSIDIFSKLNPECKIMAFEPTPKLFEKLKEKYSGNQNIHLFQMAISDKVGEKSFHENILHSSSSFEELDMNSKYLTKKSKVLGVKPNEIIKASYPVKVTTLSDFIREHCNQPIDILKIDTEGHEYYCLMGLFNGTVDVNIRFIQLEMHNDDMYLNTNSFSKVVELLNKNGYNIDAKLKHGFGDFDEVIFSKTAQK